VFQNFGLNYLFKLNRFVKHDVELSLMWIDAKQLMCI
jgi:hypothetical protein